MARWVYAEAGAPSLDSTTATETVPDSADRTYTTLAGTEFLLEPYDAPNALISEDTFTLATPGSFSELRFLIFGIGGNGTDNFQATVKYTSDLQDWSDERILGSGLGSSDDEEPEDPSRITVGFDLPERLAEPEGLDLPWFFRVESP